MKKLILGIELGSTRIKSVLLDQGGNTLAKGSYNWENSFVDGYWSYSLDEIKAGLHFSFEDLVNNYGKQITRIDAIGISGMMHGYLAFDEEYKLLVPFRTWRNITTSQASKELSEKLGFNFPQRWSATHFYQAVLNGENHVNKVAHLTTIAGYVHFLLTGKFVLGIGDASGMFPIKDKDYNIELLEKYNGLLNNHHINKNLRDLLPDILIAGDCGGNLTREGALLLDSTGNLEPGALLCPPEGDAGTGMICTNSIRPKTGNVSAGTSAFLMVVLEKSLKNYYPQIDIVTTPLGDDVAMVHVNNCTTLINSFANSVNESLDMLGYKVDQSTLFSRLFTSSNLRSSNFKNKGEAANDTKLQFLGISEVMETLIFSALSPLAIGYEILKNENVKIDYINGHGGFFKTPEVGQIAMSCALSCPIAVSDMSGEGGALGMGLLALFSLTKNKYNSLYEFLDYFFKKTDKTLINRDLNTQQKFDNWLENFKKNISNLGE